MDQTKILHLILILDFRFENALLLREKYAVLNGGNSSLGELKQFRRGEGVGVCLTWAEISKKTSQLYFFLDRVTLKYDGDFK